MAATFGERLRELRKEAGLGQIALAEKLGVGKSVISLWELNKCEPTLSNLVAIARFFDVSLDYIFGRTDNPQGKLYNYQPQFMKNGEELQELIEMCFDPKSPANAKLKRALLELLQENQK